MHVLISFLEAIAREEGFYTSGTRPFRNNNPGDIEFGKFTQAHGATGGDPRFAVFPDEASGFLAMRTLFQCPAYKGLTVAQALNRWAPPVENETNAYIANVCKWTGLTADTVIDDFLEPRLTSPPLPVGAPLPVAAAVRPIASTRPVAALPPRTAAVIRSTTAASKPTPAPRPSQSKSR